MKRAYLTTRLAVEAVIGVVMLFYCAKALIVSFAANLTIATIGGAVFGAAFIFDAFRVRRMLNQLDATADSIQK
jgi:hypothetical protein